MPEGDISDQDGISEPHYNCNLNHTSILNKPTIISINPTHHNTIYSYNTNNEAQLSYGDEGPSNFSASSLQAALATISQNLSSSSSPNASHQLIPTTGIVDTGCTTMIIPYATATSFNLPIVLLPNPFSMHYPEKGASNMITHGVLRDKTYVWNFIAISDRIDIILIDIKQAVRAGYTLVADNLAATLLSSNSPYTAVLSGPVEPNGSYLWDFQQVLNLKNPLLDWFASTRLPNLLSTWLPDPGAIFTTPTGIAQGARTSEKKVSSRFGIGYNPLAQKDMVESHQKQCCFLKQQLKRSPQVPIEASTSYLCNQLPPQLVMDFTGEPLLSDPSSSLSPPTAPVPTPPPTPTVIQTPSEEPPIFLKRPPQTNGSWSTRYAHKGTRVTAEQVRFMTLLHHNTGH